MLRAFLGLTQPPISSGALLHKSADPEAVVEKPTPLSKEKPTPPSKSSFTVKRKRVAYM
jgi:hypothetical protein